jgi:hypothetical protein
MKACCFWIGALNDLIQRALETGSSGTRDIAELFPSYRC